MYDLELHLWKRRYRQLQCLYKYKLLRADVRLCNWLHNATIRGVNSRGRRLRDCRLPPTAVLNESPGRGLLAAPMRLTLSFIVAFAVCCAQPPLAAQTPEFEVASVHRSSQPVDLPIQSFSVVGTSVRIYNYSVAQWISLAYEIPVAQVSGPGWITTERFDLWAKLPPGATKHDVPSLLHSLMMKNFALEAHKEIRKERVLVLLSAKSGATLRESAKAGIVGTSEPLREASFSKPGTLSARCNRCTLSHLAADLSNLLHESVIDLSGLAGTYDISYTVAGIELANRAANKATNLFYEDLPPTILESLRQLGLRLARQVVPVETLVVDYMARPSEN